MRDRHLYLVQNGRAYLCARGDGGYWVEPAAGELTGGDVRFWRLGAVYEADLCASLSLAGDRAEALALARAHDAGVLWPTPVAWEGLTVSALVAPEEEPIPHPGEEVAICIASAVAGLIIAAVLVAAACIAFH